MNLLLGGVLVSSFLGSLHCVGMCGGFVLLYSGENSNSKVLPHALYSLGRLVSYVSLGAVAGGAGHLLNQTGLLLGVVQIAVYGSAFLMTLWGALLIARSLNRFKGSMHGRMPDFLQKRIEKLYQKIISQPMTYRALLLGLLSTLLPCGWLYAFALTSIGTGSAWKGAWVMVFFWLGTLPAMLGFGWSIQSLSTSFRNRLPLLSGIAMLLVGVLTFFQRTNFKTLQDFQQKSQLQKTVPSVLKVPKTPLKSCCQHEK